MRRLSYRFCFRGNLSLVTSAATRSGFFNGLLVLRSSLPPLRFFRPGVLERNRSVEDRVAGAARFTIHAEVGQASRELVGLGSSVCVRAEVVLGGKTRLLSADQEADAGVAAISAVSCSISDCSRRISSSGPWARREPAHLLQRPLGQEGERLRLRR